MAVLRNVEGERSVLLQASPLAVLPVPLLTLAAKPLDQLSWPLLKLEYTSLADLAPLQTLAACPPAMLLSPIVWVAL